MPYIFGWSDPLVITLACIDSPPLEPKILAQISLIHITLDLVLIISCGLQAKENNQLALISISLFVIIFPCTSLIRKGGEYYYC